jgi:hypothetical protein
MRLRERLDATLDCRFQLAGGSSVRQMHGRLNEGQQILGGMIDLM